MTCTSILICLWLFPTVSEISRFFFQQGLNKSGMFTIQWLQFVKACADGSCLHSSRRKSTTVTAGSFDRKRGGWIWTASVLKSTANFASVGCEFIAIIIPFASGWTADIGMYDWPSKYLVSRANGSSRSQKVSSGSWWRSADYEVDCTAWSISCNILGLLTSSEMDRIWCPACLCDLSSCWRCCSVPRNSFLGIF